MKNWCKSLLILPSAIAESWLCSSIIFIMNTTHYHSFRFCLAASALLLSITPSSPSFSDEMNHRFLACGAKTYIVEADGKISWTYPHKHSRWLCAERWTQSFDAKQIERTSWWRGDRDCNRWFRETDWKGTQAEVNSAEPTANGTYVITEAGAEPRLLEVDEHGTVMVEFPLACQKPIITCKLAWLAN